MARTRSLDQAVWLVAHSYPDPLERIEMELSRKECADVKLPGTRSSYVQLCRIQGGTLQASHETTWAFASPLGGKLNTAILTAHAFGTGAYDTLLALHTGLFLMRYPMGALPTLDTSILSFLESNSARLSALGEKLEYDKYIPWPFHSKEYWRLNTLQLRWTSTSTKGRGTPYYECVRCYDHKTTSSRAHLPIRCRYEVSGYGTSPGEAMRSLAHIYRSLRRVICG